MGGGEPLPSLDSRPWPLPFGLFCSKLRIQLLESKRKKKKIHVGCSKTQRRLVREATGFICRMDQRHDRETGKERHA